MQINRDYLLLLHFTKDEIREESMPMLNGKLGLDEG